MVALLALTLGIAWPEAAHAFARWLGVQPDSRERLWLAAFSGFSTSQTKMPSGRP